MARLTILVALLLAGAGCASSTPPPVLPVATDSLEPPRFFWVPEWGMYLRQGDVVHYAGRSYAVRSGRWSVADSPDGPWSPAGEARRRADAPASARPAKGVPASGRHAVVAAAMRYVGAPYLWGSARPPGFDCSGFVKYVYGTVAVTLPRTVRAQYRIGTSVPRDELAVGDLVFFDRLRHNGIYIGDGRFVHASKSGDVVKVSGLDDDWFRQRWVGARRLPQASILSARSAQPAR
jgi:cell wall-associated NlpC family hydrolase